MKVGDAKPRAYCEEFHYGRLVARKANAVFVEVGAPLAAKTAFLYFGCL